MNHCDRCDKQYSEEFKFCPIDGTILRPAVASASVPCGKLSRVHSRKWFWILLTAAITVSATVLLLYANTRSGAQADSQVPSANQAQANSKSTPNDAPVRSRKVHEAGARVAGERLRDWRSPEVSPAESLAATDSVVGQVRVQQLVATGYRRMQQRDYQSAQDAFEEALDADPGNSAAEKGLKAARLAESVEGFSGVFQR
jgi:hypothetical protein